MRLCQLAEYGGIENEVPNIEKVRVKKQWK